MRRTLFALVTIVALYLAANLAYAIKSLAGINIDPGGDKAHHGSWFPIGDWIYQSLKEDR